MTIVLCFQATISFFPFFFFSFFHFFFFFLHWSHFILVAYKMNASETSYFELLLLESNRESKSYQVSRHESTTWKFLLKKFILSKFPTYADFNKDFIMIRDLHYRCAKRHTYMSDKVILLGQMVYPDYVTPARHIRPVLPVIEVKTESPIFTVPIGRPSKRSLSLSLSLSLPLPLPLPLSLPLPLPLPQSLPPRKMARNRSGDSPLRL